jgi:transglutaminase-like putative cysteine protease
MTRREILDQVLPSTAAAVAVFLTTLALAPTLGDGPWFVATLTVIVAMALLGTVFRLLACPGWLVIVLQGVGLLVLVTAMFAHDVALFGVIPDADVWSTFDALARDGADIINAEVAPITVTEGVQFLVVIGVGVVAWVVDAVAVTLRQATMAGVPLLTLYLVPAIVLPNGVPWPLFLLAGVGWLLLLLTDGRRELARWGRSVDDTGDVAVLHAVGGTGRRLGAAALTIAVVVPVVLPSLDDGRFDFSSSGGEGEGPGSASASEERVTTLNPITSLRRDLRQGADSLVLTYTTTTQTPDYLGVATLDGFDGFSWTLEELGADSDQQVAAGIPTPPGVSGEIAESSPQYSIQVEGLDGRRLPVPYPASHIDIAGDWRWDSDTLDVFTPSDANSLGAHYTVTQRELTPTVDQLRAAGAAETPASTLTDVPDATETVLGDLPYRVTRDAASTYDQALMLQNWFRTKFTYSLDTVVGNDDDALKQFLSDRSGYCEQFAATMALMARVLDIPARVEVGYTPGEQTGNGVWEVTAHDAHAWPELWFEGVGWVRFEPTPGGGDGGGTPAYAPPPQTDGGPGGKASTGPIQIRKGGPRFDGSGRALLPPELRKINTDPKGGDTAAVTGTSDGGQPSRWWLLLALVAVGIVAALAPMTTRAVVRRRRWRHVASGSDAVNAAWADVLDACLDVEIEGGETHTPRDVAASVPKRCRLSAEATENLRDLAGWLERLRYSRRDVEVPEVAQVRQRSEVIRNEIFASLAPRDRRQVAWWPASGRRALMQAWNALNERGTARMNAWSVAMTGWLRRRPRGAAPSAPRSGS